MYPSIRIPDHQYTIGPTQLAEQWFRDTRRELRTPMFMVQSGPDHHPSFHTLDELVNWLKHDFGTATLLSHARTLLAGLLGTEGGQSAINLTTNSGNDIVLSLIVANDPRGEITALETASVVETQLNVWATEFGVFHQGTQRLNTDIWCAELDELADMHSEVLSRKTREEKATPTKAHLYAGTALANSSDVLYNNIIPGIENQLFPHGVTGNFRLAGILGNTISGQVIIGVVAEVADNKIRYIRS